MQWRGETDEPAALLVSADSSGHLRCPGWRTLPPYNLPTQLPRSKQTHSTRRRATPSCSVSRLRVVCVWRARGACTSDEDSVPLSVPAGLRTPLPADPPNTCVHVPVGSFSSPLVGPSHRLSATALCRFICDQLVNHKAALGELILGARPERC